MTRLRRSFLFMPGDNFKMISKSCLLPADCIVMDLEDGVAPSQKNEARKVVQQAFQELDFGHREKLVRINPFQTALGREDFEQIIICQPDGLVLPKVESAQDISLVCQELSLWEKKKGWKEGSINLFALIETAMGVMKLPEIIDASKRLQALMFGAEDLAGDIGAIRTPDSWEVFYSRSAVVTAAAAARIDAIDTVHPDFRDAVGLQEQCDFSRKMGYKGKMAIHPNQLQTMNETFCPSPQEIQDAQELIAIFEEKKQSGTGAFAYKGKMVDMPMIRGAQKVIEQSELLAKRKDLI